MNDVKTSECGQPAAPKTPRRDEALLALVAHELRNPIAPLRHGVDLLRLQVGDQPAIASTLERMERQLDRLAVLVDDLLDVGRAGNDQMRLNPRLVSLSGVITCSVEASRAAVDARGQRLSVEERTPGTVVSGDFNRLVQVFSNLLGNAAKFTPAGGDIRVTLDVEGEEAVVAVRDTGVGIEAGDQQSIFGLFSRAVGEGAEPGEGLGIGLAVARSLVALHRGSLEVTSAGRGQGSTFTVRLPLAAAGEVQPDGRTHFALAAPRRVMVIDDNVDVATSLSYLLEALGHQVVVSHEGKAAVALADRIRPDVVLLDLGMPGLDGFEICRRLRALAHGERFRIVALTGWSGQAQVDATIAAGFDTYALKPVTAQRLTDLIIGEVPPAPQQNPSG